MTFTRTSLAGTLLTSRADSESSRCIGVVRVAVDLELTAAAVSAPALAVDNEIASMILTTPFGDNVMLPLHVGLGLDASECDQGRPGTYLVPTGTSTCYLCHLRAGLPVKRIHRTHRELERSHAPFAGVDELPTTGDGSGCGFNVVTASFSVPVPAPMVSESESDSESESTLWTLGLRIRQSSTLASALGTSRSPQPSSSNLQVTSIVLHAALLAIMVSGASYLE